MPSKLSVGLIESLGVKREGTIIPASSKVYLSHTNPSQETITMLDLVNNPSEKDQPLFGTIVMYSCIFGSSQ